MSIRSQNQGGGGTLIECIRGVLECVSGEAEGINFGCTSSTNEMQVLPPCMIESPLSVRKLFAVTSVYGRNTSYYTVLRMKLDVEHWQVSSAGRSWVVLTPALLEEGYVELIRLSDYHNVAAL